MSEPILVSIQVGRPRERGTAGAADPMDRPWVSAFFKEPVAGPVRVRRTNLDGDAQADLANHGGLDKAVLSYSADHYPGWRTELSRELPLGAFGENLTVAGLTEAGVCVGDVWRVGEVEFEVSQPRQPCWKLARRWRLRDLPARVVATGRSGWYLRVLREGDVAAGVPFVLVGRPNPAWTVARANQVMHHEQDDRDAAQELAAVPGLAGSWRRALLERAAEL